MPRTVQALILLAALAFAASAVQAQQPPPGGRPPPPGMGPPPPGAPGMRPPPPPPPPTVVYIPAPAPAPATEAAPQAAVIEVPKPDPLPKPVQPFPQLQNGAPPPAPLDFGEDSSGKSAGQVAAAGAATREPVAAAVSAGAMPQQLPRWLWLLGAACLLAFAGWRAALRKSRALGDEAERLARNARHLQSAHVQLKSQSEHLRQLATNDPLTGVLNRQGFSAELRQVLEHLARFRRPLSLLLFDMDNFKQINDRQGHLVGDQALKMVVGVVREHLASEDLFGRFGGDEFMVACADQPIEQSQALAESIRVAVLRSAASHEPALTGLSLSIGIAQASESQGYQAEMLFQRADTALYCAKNSGRNRVVLADESLAPPPVLETATRHLA